MFFVKCLLLASLEFQPVLIVSVGGREVLSLPYLQCNENRLLLLKLLLDMTTFARKSKSTL